ncbi:LOW QUALITY PROTEIN: serine/threonine-protein kinase ATR-like, partial [Uloborus diversus]|uniref:LOW QUALITY PROTEIN: serine/threonine-protein kinase ATR-like n=1 Tax=Uloborus diversus TaxID=327109 RepID=UPI00240A1EFC
FIAECLLTNSLQTVPEVLIMLEEIRTIFAYVDLKTFVNQNQRYILPYLISKETDHSDVLLSALSTVLHTNRSDLLINNFPFIFSHFVRHCSKGELEKALIFIQRETNLDLGSLLRCNYQLIHNELLLHLSTHYEQVFSGLSILAVKSGNVRSADAVITHSEDMADYLQPKLLGFLVFFDTQMLKSALEDKKLALESLVSIMKLMGRRAITAVRFKLMATLRIALRFKDGNFPLICCKAWNTFVHSIDITYLGPLLNQIIVALLPLLECEPKAASEIFHFLIIENRPYLCDFFHDLYFVPDIPELQEINAVLKDYIENPSNITDFYSLLCHSLKGISHENLEVRLHALQKLKQVLEANQMAINEHLLGRENVDNLLSHLVASLISGCRESDSRIRLSLGECLGELGAIDLGRLNIKSANSNETSDKFYSSIDDENFAYALVQELVHSFLAADECGIQDCSACAIQEVLKFYKCSDEKGGNYLWKKFSPDIQEILAVLFHSQYKSLQRSRKKLPVPIYQSKYGSTFQEWTKNWFYSLLQKVKKENPLKLFHSCSIIIKYDLNCTLFLLPHLVIYALLDSSETEQDEICSEILAVLTHSETSGSVSDLCQLSSQTIFSVLDHLSKWLNHIQQQTLSEFQNPKAYGKLHVSFVVMKLSQDKCYLAVKSCLTKIPQILLAKSSFACKAYARSLMHLEQYLKNHPDDLENNTSFIQKIYTALDEPDGVAGVAAIRKKETSLMDLILENEAIGDMQGAFACYEKAIKLYPDEVNYYCGLLKCFLGMDQPTTAVSYANGILSEKPEWNEKLNQYRIEAAWKLANWQSLESFLQGESCDSAWAVGVGNLLHLANNKDLDGFHKLSNTIRSSQMAPLSAVSMEKGSYLRGYEYLTRMHMLTDLQYSVKTIFNLYENEDLTAQTNTLFHEILPVLKVRGLLIQSSPRYQEPVYDLHRVLLKIGKEKYPKMARKFDQEISNCWLKSAKIARKSGCHQRAYSCLLEAGVIKSADLFIEKTKWLWDKGEKEQAIYCLQKGITEHFPSVQMAEHLVDEQQLMLAK